ncbi:hypothetical protein GTY85_30520 [Streptomyces sp. SID8377]|nr:hypothetical protein [Streptomyces sp. SID8377]
MNFRRVPGSAPGARRPARRSLRVRASRGACEIGSCRSSPPQMLRATVVASCSLVSLAVQSLRSM